MGINDADKAHIAKLLVAKEGKQINSVKEAVSYKKSLDQKTKKTGWEHSGTGDRYIPKAFR